MKLGIVGLPNVGKSTLFNAITSTKNAEAANYPFCTIEPNSGIVAVPDKRLDKLAEIWQTNKKTPAIVEFVDIAGLVKGASQGAGLGNKFLGHIRECDAIVHVVRCFDDDNIIHVVEDVSKAEAVDPIADIDAIDYELILSDLEVVQNRAGRMAKAAKSGNNKGAAAEAAWLRQGIRCQRWRCDRVPVQRLKGNPLSQNPTVLTDSPFCRCVTSSPGRGKSFLSGGARLQRTGRAIKALPLGELASRSDD